MTEGMQEWITALRSGKYTQIKHMLHNGKPNNFCVMGVSFELFRKNSNLIEWAGEYGVNISYMSDDDVRAKYLEFMGFESDEHKEVSCRKLVVMNNNGVSFKKLADIIEKDFK